MKSAPSVPSDLAFMQNSKEANTRKHFSRIDPTKVEFKDSRLRDNRFEAKSGAVGSYGEKANRDLAPVRGRDFRQEKNKKKRGAYRGGAIDTTGVHSIKFPSSDEDR